MPLAADGDPPQPPIGGSPKCLPGTGGRGWPPVPPDRKVALWVLTVEGTRPWDPLCREGALGLCPSEGVWGV